MSFAFARKQSEIQDLHPRFRGPKFARETRSIVRCALIGQALMRYALDFARSRGWKKLVLYSNRKLENSLHIYRKYGFQEIEMETDNPYSRGEIKMMLGLSGAK